MKSVMHKSTKRSSCLVLTTIIKPLTAQEKPFVRIVYEPVK